MREIPAWFAKRTFNVQKVMFFWDIDKAGQEEPKRTRENQDIGPTGGLDRFLFEHHRTGRAK